MIELILHGIGDYLIQNDWMATNKKKTTLEGELACQIHCITYTIPFYMWYGDLTLALYIYILHYAIDGFKIVDWFLAVRNGVLDITNFGFSQDRPALITVWLYIITDNIFHIICNYIVINHLSY